MPDDASMSAGKLQAGAGTRPRGKKMTERAMTAAPETTQVLPARLEPDAIGAAQDTIIGMANSAPTVAIGLSLAGLAASQLQDPAAGPRRRTTASPPHYAPQVPLCRTAHGGNIGLRHG